MKKIMSIFLLVASCLSGMGQETESFVTGLLEQYPKVRLLDIYKSCFQDYMGAEHLVGDTATVKGYLEQELSMTEVSDLQQWYYEPCGMCGNYVRVSLRAVKEGFINADELINAFIASANGVERPSIDAWAGRWHDILSSIDQMNIPLPSYDQDKQFIEEVLAQGRYAISHSPEYREAYAPHYRIVKRDIFERDLLPKLPCCCH